MLRDHHAIALAVATAIGAVLGRRLPAAEAASPVLVGSALVAALAVVARRPWIVCLAAGLVAAVLAARAWAGLGPPPTGATLSGRATLVSDPVDALGATRVDLRVGHRRVEAWVRGRPRAVLAEMLAGERVQVAGALSVVPEASRERLATVHVGARLSVSSLEAAGHGTVFDRTANGLRRLLMRGASSLPGGQRALFAGVVLGDDRDEPAAIADDFTASGLAHLLAVSGENVVFALALASPLLKRLGLVGRLVAGLLVLAFFGLLVRWQPSVLRAEAMAALTMVATTLGRPASAVRLLAIAVAGLVLVDPLLVWSTGFRLSVGATLGIALLAGPLAERLPGPEPVAAALAATIAAQVGVAPVLVGAFGGVPVASIPANLLAVPAAGPVMVWGLAAGLPAGVIGGRTAALLHVPTRVLIAWIAGVARFFAAAPLGALGLASVVGASVLGAAACWRRCPRRWRRPAGAGCLALVLVPGLSPLVRAPPALAGAEVAAGASLWRAGGAVVLVLDGAGGRQVLAGLRSARVDRLDVLVCRQHGANALAALGPLLERVPVRALVGPPGLAVAGASVAFAGEVIRAGPLVVRVRAVATRLDVDVGPGP